MYSARLWLVGFKFETAWLHVFKCPKAAVKAQLREFLDRTVELEGFQGQRRSRALCKMRESDCL